MISVFGSVMMLGMVYWLTLQESHNLLYFVFAFGISSVVSKAVYIAYFFVKNSDVFPSISTISIRKMYEIFDDEYLDYPNIGATVCADL